MRAVSAAPGQRSVLAIGPDGGWVSFEAQLLESHGFRPFSLGPRILRVETAVPVLVGQVALLAEDTAARQGASRA
nr:RsmE family RNA methyltransferase [Myxococcus sp. AM011]